MLGQFETSIDEEIAEYAAYRDPMGKLSYDVIVEEFWRDLGIDRFGAPSISTTFAIVE